jgi:hypothetical protein
MAVTPSSCDGHDRALPRSRSVACFEAPAARRQDGGSSVMLTDSMFANSMFVEPNS